MAQVTHTETDSNGNIINTVTADSQDSLTLATSGTYLDKNIVFNISVGGTDGIDTSDATATAEDIVKGKTAYVNGQKIEGSINTGNGGATLEYANFKELDHYNMNSVYLHAVGEIPESVYLPKGAEVRTDIWDADFGDATNPDVLEGKTFTTTHGYKQQGSIPSKTAETITPSTSDQVISSGQYLAGDQTIQGDANLLPENIVSGVSIFGVTGTHEDSSSDSGIDTSDATATRADILAGKTAYVNGKKVTGGYKLTSATISSSITSDATSISFTVTGEPLMWSVVQGAQSRDWQSNLRFIVACNSTGASTSMATSSSYGYQYPFASYIDSTYADGTLTITTNSSTNTGNFRGGISYQLSYIYAEVEDLDEPELQDGEVGWIDDDFNIKIAESAGLNSDTYTLYYEDDSENKLTGWTPIGTIHQ